ncbi:MAG: hypothetical protein ACRCV3_00890 [Desulfovibrionaceae bacterium]
MADEKKSNASVFPIIGVLVVAVVIGGAAVWLKTTTGVLNEEIAEELVVQSKTFPHIVTLEKVVQGSPENAPLWVQLANAYFDEGEFKKALVAYEMAINLQHITPEVLVDYASSLRKEGRLQESLQQYNKALLLAPKYSVGLYNKGLLLYYDLGEKEDAFTVWDILVKTSPNAKTSDGQQVKDFVAKLRNLSMAPTLQ